jgi:hypothetical protein
MDQNGILFVTLPGAYPEKTRRGAIIHCPACQAQTAFNGRRVSMDIANPSPTRGTITRN